MRVRFAPSPTGPAARRQRAHGALQLAARARPRRHVHPAHRGHRRRAIDQGVGGRASSRICAGSGSTGTRGPTSAAPRGPYRQSERLHLYTLVRERAAGRRPRLLLLLLAAEARGRPQGGCSRRAGRRDTPAPAARSVAEEAQRRIDAGERAGRPLPRARARRRHLPGSRPRRGHVQHRRHRRSGARPLRRPSRRTTSPWSSTMR